MLKNCCCVRRCVTEISLGQSDDHVNATPLEKKSYELYKMIRILLKFVPKSPIDKNSTNLDNGLAPNRLQTIIWTKTDPIHWRIYAALAGVKNTILIYDFM